MLWMKCPATHRALPFVLVPLIIDAEFAGVFLQMAVFSIASNLQCEWVRLFKALPLPLTETES